MSRVSNTLARLFSTSFYACYIARQIGWHALQKLGDGPALKLTLPVAELLEVDEEGVAASSPGVTEDGDSLEAFESAALRSASAAIAPHGEEVDAVSELSKPLLGGDASSELTSQS